MPTNVYRGDAIEYAKEYTADFADWENGDIASATIGNKTITYAASSGTDAASGLAALINNSRIPEFQEVVATDDDSRITVTSRVAGRDVIMTFGASNNPDLAGGSVVITETVKGAAQQGEKQKIRLIGTYSGGTWTWTNDFGSGNETTSAIAYGAADSAVETAIESMASVTSGDVTVTKISDDEYDLEWDGGDKLGVEIAEGSIDGGSLTGTGGVEIQELQKGGDKTDHIFTLAGKYATNEASAQIYFNDGSTTEVSEFVNLVTDSLDDIKAKLEAMSNIGEGNVEVYGGPVDAQGFDRHWDDEDFKMWDYVYYIRMTGALGQTYIPDPSAHIKAVRHWGAANVEQPSEGTFQAGGQDGRHEVQIVYLGTQPEDEADMDDYTGSQPVYTLTYDFGSGDETTGDLLWDNSGTGLASAIQSLASVGSGNAPTVYGSGSSPFRGIYVLVWENGTFAGTDVDNPTINYSESEGLGRGDRLPEAYEVQPGGSAAEIVQITIFATGGTYDLTDGTDTTSALNWNDSAATLETELESDITALVDVTVSGAGTPADPYLVTIADPAGDFADLSVDTNSLTGGGGRVTEIESHHPGANEVLTIEVDPLATGGTFDLTLDLGSGDETASGIAYNVSAANLQTALEGLASASAGDWAVSGANPYTVEGQNNLSNTDLNPMTGDGTNLDGPHDQQNVTVSVSQVSLGPEHANDPLNWTLDRVPETGDDVKVTGSSKSIRYGMNWIREFTVDTATDQLVFTKEHDFADEQKVTVSSSGTLPAGLSAGDYYIIYVDHLNVQLSATRGGAAETITDAGTGTHTAAVEFASFDRHSRHTGQIGLDERNDDATEYYEYRDRYWRFGLQSSGDKRITNGKGEGDSSPLTMIDNGDYQVDVEVYATAGSLITGVPAFLHLNNNANSLLTVHDGEVGCHYFAGESGQYSKITQHEGLLDLGEGHTIAALHKTGGELLSNGGSFSGPIYILG